MAEDQKPCVQHLVQDISDRRRARVLRVPVRWGERVCVVGDLYAGPGAGFGGGFEGGRGAEAGALMEGIRGPEGQVARQLADEEERVEVLV